MIDITTLYTGYMHRYSGSNVLGGTTGNADAVAILLIGFFLMSVCGGMLYAIDKKKKEDTQAKFIGDTVKGFFIVLAYGIGILLMTGVICFGMLWLTKLLGGYLSQWIH